MLAALILQMVFVHANGRVALERAAGDASYALFAKGREPARTPDGKRLFFWTNDGIVWADVDGGGHGTWRAGNLRSPRVSPDGTQLVWGEMVDGQWAVESLPSGGRTFCLMPLRPLVKISVIFFLASSSETPFASNVASQKIVVR